MIDEEKKEIVSAEEGPEPKEEESPIVEEVKEAAPVSEETEGNGEDKEESEYTDEHPYQPTPAPAPKEEEGEKVTLLKEGEKSPEELRKEMEEREKAARSAPAPIFAYEDERLAHMEEARALFQKEYKKANRWKTPITIIGIGIILVSWLVPSFIDSLKDYAWVFGLCFCVVAIAGIAVYTIFANKASKKAMDAYFDSFFNDYNDYTFGSRVSDLRQDIDAKLDPEVFKGANLYKDVNRVTSRNFLTFNYKGRSVSYSECAAQSVDNKIAKTVFIGDILVINNGYTGKDVAIYRKGNARALPPTNFKAFGDLFEDTSDMVVYGPKTAKSILTKRVRDALATFVTNATFVDFSIAILPGKTYFLLGYEDDLMVLPMRDPMDPKPYMQHRADIQKVFDFIDVLDETLK